MNEREMLTVAIRAWSYLSSHNHRPAMEQTPERDYVRVRCLECERGARFIRSGTAWTGIATGDDYLDWCPGRSATVAGPALAKREQKIGDTWRAP